MAVARSALLDLARGYLEARERAESLTPDQEYAYCVIAETLKKTEPEWEAYCRVQRLKERRAEPRKSGRHAQAKGLWQDRIEKLMRVWPRVAPVHGRAGIAWQEKAIELYASSHGERLSRRTVERIVERAQAAGLIRRLRRRTA